MAKISKAEFLNNIQNIINEGLVPDADFDYTAKFNVLRYIDELFDEGQDNPSLMEYLANYRKMLSTEPEKQFIYYEDFGKGLANYASGNKHVQDIIRDMNVTLNANGAELRIRCLADNIQNPDEQEVVLTAFNNFIQNNDQYSRNILLDALYAMNGDQDISDSIQTILDNDMISPIRQINPFSRLDDIKNRLKNDEFQRRKDEINSQVLDYATKVFDEAEEENRMAAIAEEMSCKFEAIVNNNGINLRESIRNIASSDAKSNKKLMETLEQYAGALNQGLYEEKLYEGFLMNLNKYDYLRPVEKEIKRINEAVNKSKVSVILTKISEDMSESPSYYIIPLIEEDLARFVKNPTEVNRVQLRNILCPFASNPFCGQMLEAIERNYDAMAHTIDEKVMTFNDRIKMIKEDATVSSIYSPVQYIKENECVFNANGQFYVKKNNTLARLSNEYLNQLSERFISLCQLVNSPNVAINEGSIVLCGTDKVATIYEGYAEINGQKETRESLRNLNEMCFKYDYDTNFFIMASCLLENFDNIANINFGKHIRLKNSNSINVDLFRLDDNIFINTVNEDMNKATFYQNVNPLQCSNIINKHMGINVASLFEDLLPSQEKILMQLNETKSEYEKSIEKYEKTIEDLEKAKDACVSDDGLKKIEDAIEDATSKLDDIKAEYKDWQDSVDKTTGNDSDDENDTPANDEENVEIETSSEPIDAEDVPDAEAELKTPLNNGEMTDDTEEDPFISDDEFDSYLEGDTNPDAGANQEDDINFEDEPEPDTDTLPTVGDDIEDEPMDVPAEDTEIAPEDDINFDDDDETDFNMNDIDHDIETPDTESIDVPAGYQISTITFDKNVQTSQIYNTGKILVVCPMVDAEGEVYVDKNEYDFYIDKNTHLPIINAEEIPVTLYNAMVSSIQAEDDFAIADANGEERPNNGGKDVTDDVIVNKPKNFFTDDELEGDDEDDNEFFNFEDDDDSFTMTPKEDITIDEPAEEESAPLAKLASKTDDEKISARDLFDFPEDDEPIVSPEDVPAPTKDPVKTYKNDGTEMEFPAEEIADMGNDIPEATTDELDDLVQSEGEEIEDDDINFDELMSDDNNGDEMNLDDLAQAEGDEIDVDLDDINFDDEEEMPRPKKKAKVEENYNKVVKIKGGIKKNGRDFFISEGTIKPSKKQVVHVNEKNVDGIGTSDETPMFEEYDENAYLDTLEIMRRHAQNLVSEVNPMSLKGMSISDMQETDGIEHFAVYDSREDGNDYMVYRIGNRICYRPLDEFNDIMFNINGQLSTRSALANRYDDPTVELDYIDVNDVDGCKDLADTILSTLGVYPRKVTETVTIKEPSLSSEHDIMKSKMVDDILYGDENDRKFREKVNAECKKEEIPNPLMPQAQQESIHILPNVHSVVENSVNLDDYDIVYEPQDWVIIKKNDMKAQVNDVVNNYDGELTMLTVLASDGHIYQVTPKDIKPDPLYLDNIPGRVMNSQNLYVPEKGMFDIDPKTRMTRPARNEEPVVMADLNKKTTPVYIMAEGVRVNDVPYSALTEDISLSKKTIRVINE